MIRTKPGRVSRGGDYGATQEQPTFQDALKIGGGDRLVPALREWLGVVRGTNRSRHCLDAHFRERASDSCLHVTGDC